MISEGNIAETEGQFLDQLSISGSFRKVASVGTSYHNSGGLDTEANTTAGIFSLSLENFLTFLPLNSVQCSCKSVQGYLFIIQEIYPVIKVFIKTLSLATKNMSCRTALCYQMTLTKDLRLP